MGRRERPSRALSRIFTSTQIATMAVESIKDRASGMTYRLMTGVSTLDRILIPFFPGELVSVLARTSNYKTGFMSFLARQFSGQLLDMDPDWQKREVVFYVSWETSEEELSAYDIASISGLDATRLWRGEISQDEMLRAVDAGLKRAAQPIWHIGHSLARRKQRERLTLPYVHEALMACEDEMGVRVRAIFLDYLQEIDPSEGDNLREKTMDSIERSKQLARDMGCPVFLGVQAGRQVDERDFKLPQVQDAQESSRLEQASDKLIALWLPRNHLAIGELVPKTDWPVTANLLILGLRKQRMAESGQILPLAIDFVHNRIEPMDFAEYDMEERPVPESSLSRARRKAERDGSAGF